VFSGSSVYTRAEDNATGQLALSPSRSEQQSSGAKIGNGRQKATFGDPVTLKFLKKQSRAPAEFEPGRGLAVG
jgi:hypothetical protein